MKKIAECMCEDGIKSVVVCGEVVQEYCECWKGDLRMREDQGDSEEDLAAPFPHPANAFDVIGWFNA